MPDLVTVIVPTFDGTEHLASTLDSLAGQDYPAVEVIVVDDGSRDDSVAVARAHPGVTRVVEQRNWGAAVARNRGLAEARGRWVAFLDQDDLWHATRLSRLVALAQETGSLAVASREQTFALEEDRAALARVGDGRDRWVERWIPAGTEAALAAGPLASSSSDGDGEDLEHLTVERFLGGAQVITTSFLYDRVTAISAGGCAVHARALDDHVLATNVARLNGGSIPRAAAKDLFYRIHPVSATTTSPLSAPFLSTQAALRLGGILPNVQAVGPNVEHLLFGLASSPVTPSEQLALLTLTVPPRARARWFARWAVRRLGLRR